jgi:hypothetical protein
MFEVARDDAINIYEGSMEDGFTSMYGLTFVEVDGPLIKVRGLAGSKPMIINTHSPAFVSATLDD